MVDLFNPQSIQDQKVSLNEEDNTPQTASLDMGVLQPTALPVDVQDRRSYMTSEGLGAVLGKPYKDISQDISNGQEGSLRQQAAANIDYQNQIQRQSMIREATLRKGTPLTNDEVSRMLQVKPANPNSIIEQGYGHSVVNTLDEADKNMGGTVLSDSKEDTPGVLTQDKVKGSRLLTSILRARTEAENLQNQIGQQSWLGWGWDFAKTFFQPYDEVKLRGLVNGNYFGALGLGSVVDQQTSDLISKPLEEQNAFWEGDAWKKLKSDNPQVAMAFLQSFLGQSSMDSNMSSMNTYLMGAAALGTASKVSKVISNINTVRSAVRKVAEASNLPKVDKATMLNAAGDTEGAAVERATSNMVQELGGNTSPDYLTKRAVDAMPGTMRSDLFKFREGAAGREIINRLDQNSEATIAAVQERAANMLKVPRGQEVTNSKEAWAAIIKDQKEQYRGPGQSLLESEGNFYDERSNTHYVLHKLGREDATYFSTVEEALGWGEKNGFLPKIPQNYYYAVSNKIEDLRKALDASLAQGFKDIPAMKRHVDMQNELEGLVRHKADIDLRGRDGFPVLNDGLGHYIAYFQPVEETGRVYNSFIAKTKESQLQPTWANGISRWGRTPLETMSKYDNQARVIAATGPGRLLETFKEGSKPIDRLPGKDWPELNRALAYAQKHPDPKTGIPGHYFDNISELENWWNTTFNHLPSDAQIEAYHAFRTNYEAERQLRITQKTTGKVRRGAQQHRLYIKDYTPIPGQTKFAKPKDVVSPFFDGIIQKEAPAGGDTVLVLGHTDGELMQASSIQFSKVKKEIEEGGKGWQTIRLYDPDAGEGPLRGYAGVGDQRVRWVVTKGRVDTKPIDYNNQVGRTGGGHLIYDYQHNLKIAKMSHDDVANHWNYKGDLTLEAVEHPSDGEAFAKHLDKIYDFMADEKPSFAKKYHKDNKLGTAWEKIESLFKPTKDAEGNVRPPRIPLIKEAGLRPRFTVVPRNQLIIDINKNLEDQYGGKARFRDRTRYGSDARQDAVEFTGERDAFDFMALDNAGTSANPIWQHEPANVIDPLPAYNRALNRIIQSSFNNDYKTASVQRWLAQARHLLEDKDNDILRSPFTVFSDPTWKKGADKIEKSALLSARFNINQFIGTPSVVDSYLNTLANRIAETAYKHNPTIGNLIAHAWELPYIRNPIAFGRTVTFHLGMGLFSIPQFFMQLTTGANVLAIGGARHFESTMSGAYFYYLSKLNKTPEILADLDRKASRFGWKPGEWTEFRELMHENTGFETIGGEHALLDTPFNSKIVMNGGQKILDWGEAPFRQGAKNTRILAMAMAYKEFRSGAMEGRTFSGTQITRPGSETGRLTKEDKAAILDRASDLDHNMTRAGSSLLHTGVMSPVGQFTAYSLRLAELMTGKRLTWQEKTRLFTVSSVLYGLPVGGLGLLGVPVTDYIRQKAMEAGHDIDDNFIERVFNRGLPSAMMGVITGVDYDFEKFGAKGAPQAELLWTDSSIMKALGGAMFGKAMNLAAETGSIRRALMAHMMGSQDEYPVTADDVLGVFYKEASFPNAIVRGLYALNTGKWISKNGTVLQQDVGAGQALMQTFSGMVDTKVSDITVSANALKARKEADLNTEKLYVQAVHNWMRALDDNDPQAAENYSKQAWVIMNVLGDYPQAKRADLIRRALEDRIDLVSRLNREFYRGKDVPASKGTSYLETYMEKKERTQ